MNDDKEEYFYPDPPKYMKSGGYSVRLIEGNHGIWCYVFGPSKIGWLTDVIMEQSGFKSTSDAMDWAKAIIEAEEKKP
jgi:hypothetical protein